LPLSEKARVEVYLPDLPAPVYQRLLDALEQGFTYAFGGCTVLHGLSGSYLSNYGLIIKDRVNLLYTDTPFAFSENQATLSLYRAVGFIRQLLKRQVHCDRAARKHMQLFPPLRVILK